MKNNNSTPCAKATEGAVGEVILCLRTQGSSWSLSALTRTHRSTGQLQDYCFMGFMSLKARFFALQIKISPVRNSKGSFVQKKSQI